MLLLRHENLSATKSCAKTSISIKGYYSMTNMRIRFFQKPNSTRLSAKCKGDSGENDVEIGKRKNLGHDSALKVISS